MGKRSRVQSENEHSPERIIQHHHLELDWTLFSQTQSLMGSCNQNHYLDCKECIIHHPDCRECIMTCKLTGPIEHMNHHAKDATSIELNDNLHNHQEREQRIDQHK